MSASANLTGVLRALGLRPAGGNHRSVRGHVRRLGLDTSHFARDGRSPDVLAFHAGRRLAADEVFRADSRVNRTTLRGRARALLVPYECAVCANPGRHAGRALALQLDHVNGIADDNRMSNLRWPCPNCHSQTETYCGRSSRRRAPVCHAPTA